TAGHMDTAVPRYTRGEIGAMAKTLRLFRESVAERERLSKEAQDQRRMLTTAIGSISQGFVLYDSQDRLVLCNSKFREMYPRIADIMVPGASFEQVLRATMERQVIDLRGLTPEEWIAARLAQHANPQGFPEYRYGNVWARISERR